MSREAEFAAARMRHSAWSESYSAIMSCRAKSKRVKLKRKAVALICADRAEMAMHRFFAGCIEEYPL
ncbi:hypothetical protein [Enterobacter roggenkampii]|uniref:hypothetical protein n=1 Tax=Enterobacter roggenkampii TaxID=1812935 RepID=UPI001F2C1D88|nr:hypothetical protein [Enterobacter roggenkampii]MDV0393215.1 hypothetical protein [Enterobacter roggenkampii]